MRSVTLERAAHPETLTVLQPFLDPQPCATAWGRVEKHADTYRVSTSATPWAYAAVFGVTRGLKSESSVLVAVTGKAALAKVGVLFEDDSGLLREVFFEPSDEPRTQFLTIPRITPALTLVVRTAEEPSAGCFDLLAVEAAAGFDGFFRDEVKELDGGRWLYAEHVIADFKSLGELQATYLNRAAAAVRPNVRILRTDKTTYFETNEWGFKAGPIDSSCDQVAVWGNSVVWGIGPGWVSLIDQWAPGYQFLNAGMEGIGYTTVLERAVTGNQQHEFELNLIMPGVLPVLAPLEVVEERLLGALSRIPHPILITAPLALHHRIRDHDLSSLFVSPELPEPVYMERWCETAYAHMGGTYSVARQVEWFDDCVKRNEMVRRVSSSAHIPLVDLARELDSSSCEDFRELFFDGGHPRPRTYPRIARFVFDSVRELIREADDRSSKRSLARVCAGHEHHFQ